MDNIICIIPARGHSAGVPNKNLQLLGGVPLVVHSILSALDAGLTKIVVSSDSAEILTVAQREGVDILQRPSELATADSSTESALMHVLDNLPGSYEYVLLLQPTSPFRLKNTVSNFIDFCISNQYDSALTATKFYNFFWQRSEEGWVSNYDTVNRPMRQHLDEVSDFRYFDNGNMYMTRTDILRTSNSRLAGRVGVYPISELEGMQIDTPKDLKICRAIFKVTDELSGDKSSR